MTASERVDLIFRESYGKVLAYLLARGFDLLRSEDAVSAAFTAALTEWNDALPPNPEAWLCRVALHRVIDIERRERRITPLESLAETADPTEPEDPTMLPDERLRLFFLCTHPAIAAEIQTPLMLQLVLGMSAESMSELFLLPSATLGQRLVRAKRKIRDAQILPELPNAEEFQQRLPSVLQAIYGLYCRDWGTTEPTEAMDLARSLVIASEGDPEAMGLFALLLFCESRRTVERDVYVPLSQQDPSDWDQEMITRAEQLLQAAAARKSPGRFQLEAAIQSAHVQRAFTGSPSYAQIARLYEALITMAPTTSNRLGHVAATLEANGPEAALALLSTIQLTEPYLPYEAVSAHVALRFNDLTAARKHAEAARALSKDPKTAAYWGEMIQTIQNP